MGNRIISFATPSNAKPKPYTYADISMVADKRVANVKTYPEDVEVGDYAVKYRFAKNLDVNAVKCSVRNMFEWVPGERILLPEYGNKLRSILYEGITDFTAEKLMNELKNMVFRWEPRAVIDKVFRKPSVEETENNQMSVIMVWHVAGLPEQKYQEEILL